MSRSRLYMTVLLSVFALTGLVALSPAWADDTPERQGTIDSIDRPDGKMYLNVTLVSEDGQPADPRLSTGVADPSKVTSYTEGKTVVVEGSVVRLIITRQNAVFTPDIGAVEQVLDKKHCVVRVDQGLLDKTWQDPSDGNNTHKVGEYLQAGATVTIYGVTNF